VCRPPRIAPMFMFRGRSSGYSAVRVFGSRADECRADGTWKVPATFLHCDNFPIICTIRSVTTFSSASILSCSLGGLNT